MKLNRAFFQRDSNSPLGSGVTSISEHIPSIGRIKYRRSASERSSVGHRFTPTGSFSLDNPIGLAMERNLLAMCARHNQAVQQATQIPVGMPVSDRLQIQIEVARKVVATTFTSANDMDTARFTVLKLHGSVTRSPYGLAPQKKTSAESPPSRLGIAPVSRGIAAIVEEQVRSRLEISQASLEARYRQLNKRYYAGELTAEEEQEWKEVETALDELDQQDPLLQNAAGQITHSYERLERELEAINARLEKLLNS